MRKTAVQVSTRLTAKLRFWGGVMFWVTVVLATAEQPLVAVTLSVLVPETETGKLSVVLLWLVTNAPPLKR